MTSEPTLPRDYESRLPVSSLYHTTWNLLLTALEHLNASQICDALREMDAITAVEPTNSAEWHQYFAAHSTQSLRPVWLARTTTEGVDYSDVVGAYQQVAAVLASHEFTPRHHPKHEALAATTVLALALRGTTGVLPLIDAPQNQVGDFFGLEFPDGFYLPVAAGLHDITAPGLCSIGLGPLLDNVRYEVGDRFAAQFNPLNENTRYLTLAEMCRQNIVGEAADADVPTAGTMMLNAATNELLRRATEYVV